MSARTPHCALWIRGRCSLRSPPTWSGQFRLPRYMWTFWVSPAWGDVPYGKGNLSWVDSHSLKQGRLMGARPGPRGSSAHLEEQGGSSTQPQHLPCLSPPQLELLPTLGWLCQLAPFLGKGKAGAWPLPGESSPSSALLRGMSVQLLIRSLTETSRAVLRLGACHVLTERWCLCFRNFCHSWRRQRRAWGRRG